MLKTIHVVTLFPEMFSPLEYGVIGRFIASGSVAIRFWNPRDYAQNAQGYIDDVAYGGGGGMIIQAEPLAQTMEAIGQAGHRVYLSPAGKPWCHQGAAGCAKMETLTLICGRYEGIDQRFCDAHVDAMLSVGDFVLSGGELAALVVIDSILRLIPGCLGNASASENDSHVEGRLDYPHYTRPKVWRGHAVPDALTSGDHAKIARWREKEALGQTWLHRPDLLCKDLDCKQKELLLEYASEYLTRHEESS